MSPTLPSRRRAPRVLALAPFALLALAACATTGATFRSGVGDRFLEHPPYYAGAAVADTGRVGHLPVAYQPGGSQPAAFDPAGGAGSPVARLLAEMNAYLDSLGATVRVAAGAPPAGTPPDVTFGCETDAAGDCADGSDPEVTALGRGGETLRLAVGRPSPTWAAWAATAMDSAGVAEAIVLTLEVGQYRLRQRGLRGDKVVELGTGHTAPVPWLTSLESPVSVLQLTAARVRRDGQAVRIGAEGILARRTPLLASAVGAQALLRDEDVEQARTLRRDDLPGQPLAWQVALRHLVAQLTGKGEIAAAR